MEIKDNILDPLESNVAVKRIPSSGDGTSTEISKNETPKKKKSKISSEQLSPVMTLHQLDPNLIYEFSESGPPHAKVFTASLTLGEQTYSATGPSKKTAKANVAEVALQCCIQLENSAAIFNNSSAMDVKEDFSQDDVDIMNTFNSFCPTAMLERRIENEQLTEQNNPKAASSSPTYVLNYLRSGLIYEIIKEEGKPHQRIFTAQVVLDGSVYEGTGPTKNLAKHAAAYEALKVHFISHLPAVIPPSSTGVSESSEEPEPEIDT